MAGSDGCSDLCEGQVASCRGGQELMRMAQLDLSKPTVNTEQCPHFLKFAQFIKECKLSNIIDLLKDIKTLKVRL